MGHDEDAVRDALAALDEAFDRRDLAGILDLCTEDVVFIGSGAGEEAVGRDKIGPMFDALAPHLEDLEFSVAWESVDVEIHGDVALMHAVGSATLITARRNDVLRYRMTGVLVRDGGHWRWRVFHGSEPGSW